MAFVCQFNDNFVPLRKKYVPWWNIQRTNRNTKLLSYPFWIQEGRTPSNKVFILHNRAPTALFRCQSCWGSTLWISYETREEKKGKKESGKHRKLKPKLIPSYPTWQPCVWVGVRLLQNVVCRLKRSRVTAERKAGMLFWWCRWRATISPSVLENSVSISCMLPWEPCTHTHTHTRSHQKTIHTIKQ